MPKNARYISAASTPAESAWSTSFDAWSDGARERSGGRLPQLLRHKIIDIDDLHHLAVIVGEQPRFGLGKNAECARLLDLARQIKRRQTPGLLALDPQPPLQRLGRGGQFQHPLKRSERVAGLGGAIYQAAQPRARGGVVLHQVGDAASEAVAGGKIGQPAREYQQPHYRRQWAAGEIAQHAVQLLLRLIEELAAGPFDHRQLLGRLPLVVVVLW